MSACHIIQAMYLDANFPQIVEGTAILRSRVQLLLL